MIIEETKALGASILFFPEGKAVQAGGVCGPDAMPDPNDPGWIDFIRVESWEGGRKDAKYEPVKDSSIGKLQLGDEIEVDGYTEYKFTTNVLLGFIIGLFFRSAAPLNGNSYQFNPDTGVSPRGWLLIDNRDQKGVLILSANLWGRVKCDSALKGGAGSIVKPEIVFTQYKNSQNVMAIGAP